MYFDPRTARGPRHQIRDGTGEGRGRSNAAGDGDLLSGRLQAATPSLERVDRAKQALANDVGFAFDDLLAFGKLAHTACSLSSRMSSSTWWRVRSSRCLGKSA